MHAIQVHEFGDASKLSFDDVAVPEPQAGQVRVRVAATGLNFVEVYHRKGQYPNLLPMTLGAEVAGVVDAVGEGVTDFHPGDRVGTANGIGGYAEYAIAPAAKLLHVPAAISLEQAAAVLLQGMTAHYLALSTFPLKAGDTALMHAAAGGVGHLLVQIGRRRGARILATVSTDEKAQLARMAGAEEVILYTTDNFETAVKRLTGGKGADVVYDSVGQTTFAMSLNCLKPRGMLVLYGQASGPVEPVNPQVLSQKGSLFLTRPTLAHYVLTREELEWRANDLFNWMSAGELIVRIDRRFPLAQAADAQTYMETRGTRGKVLLIP